MKKWTSLVLGCVLTLSMSLPVSAAVPGVTDRMVGAKKGLVAASHPLAAEVGRKVLADGGNAVDAAVAMQFALNVVEPMMSGIGGGGFMMIYNKAEDEVAILDSREVAPKQVRPDMFLDKNGKPTPWFERHTSGKAVGVPGTLLGVETALQRYGTKPLSEVIDPAIAYAEQGVPVNWATANYIGENVPKLQQYGTAADVFLRNGKPLKEGDLLVQKDLAKTLKLIKEQGSAALYKGEIGQAMVAEVQKRGGSMTMEDLQNYTVKKRDAVRGTYRGYEIASMPSPSSGGLTLLEIMKMMEKYNIQQMGPNSTDYLHRLIEVSHLAYADRAAFMADEEYHKVPKDGLLSPGYIGERSALVNPRRASSKVKAGNPWKYDQMNGFGAVVPQEENPIGQTTHFSVVDQWGNMVAYTTTIEQVFGTGIMVPGYGFMLNNEMTDFDAVPGGANQIEPGKRPLSSMAPTMVFKDHQPYMALGSPGGPTIIMSVAQTLFNVIDFNMPLQEAIEAPRVYSNAYPKVSWERGIDQKVLFGLMKKGHSMDSKPTDIGNVQAVIYDAATGMMYGGADNTRQGAVLGVEQVSYIAKPPQQPAKTSNPVVRLKVDDQEYPFQDGQVFLQNSWSYADAELLLLALGADDQSILRDQIISIGEDEYLPVRKTAEQLGYTVAWDAAEQTVLLTKGQSGAEDGQ